MTDDGDRIGSLSVDIIADTAPLEGAKGRVGDILGTFPQELRIKVDASELTNVQAAARAVASALRAVHKTAADVPAGSATKLKFTVDTAKIRSDIDAVLKEPFKIKLEISNLAEIRSLIGESIPVTVQHHGTAAGVVHAAMPASEHNQPGAQAAPSAARTIIDSNPELRKHLVALHDNFDRLLQASGRPGLGGSPADDPTTKFNRLVNRIGNKLNDFIEIGDNNKVKGGALSNTTLKAAGFDREDASTIAGLARDFQSIAKTTALFDHARNEPVTTSVPPAVATAIHHAEARATAATAAAVREAVPHAVKASEKTSNFDTSTLLGRLQAAVANKGPLFQGPSGAQPLKNDLSDTLREFTEIQQKTYRQSQAQRMPGPAFARPSARYTALKGELDSITTEKTRSDPKWAMTRDVVLSEMEGEQDATAKKLRSEIARRMRRNRGGFDPSARNAGSTLFGTGDAAPEPEQEAASARIQPNRQLTGRLTFMDGGVARDLSGLASAASLGMFNRLGRETSGPKRQVTLTDEDMLAFQTISASGTKSSKQRAMIGGREIERVTKPFDEFVNQAEALYGPAARKAIEERSRRGATLRGEINKFIEAGNRLTDGAAGATPRNTAQMGRNTEYGSGEGGFTDQAVRRADTARSFENAAGRKLFTRRSLARRAFNLGDKMVMRRGASEWMRSAAAEHSRVAQARVAQDPERVEREFNEALQVARIKGGIDEGSLPSMDVMTAELLRRLPGATAGRESLGGRTSGSGGEATGKEPGASVGGTGAGYRAVDETFLKMLGEISNALHLDIDTTQPIKKVLSKLSSANLGYLAHPREGVRGAIAQGELYAKQDVARMRDEGAGDRLGERVSSTKWSVEKGVYTAKTRIVAPPMTPSQQNAARMRRERSERYQAYQANILHAAPVPEGATSHAFGTSVGERSDKTLTDDEKQYVADQAAEQKRVYDADTAAINAELDKARKAAAYIGKQSGFGVEELAASKTGPRANVGGQLKPVYGGRRIRALDHREEPIVQFVEPNPEGYTHQAEALRKRLKSLYRPQSEGPATPLPGKEAEAQQVQLQLEKALTRAKLTATGKDRPEILAGLDSSGLDPEVQEEVRAMLSRSLVKAAGRPRRSKGTRGATSQQLRERALAANPFAAGTNEPGTIMPYSKNSVVPESEAPMAAISGAGSTISGGGGGSRGGSSVIDVRVISSVPIEIRGSGSTSSGGGEGEVIEVAAGGGGGRRRKGGRGTPTGPTPPPPGSGDPEVKVGDSSRMPTKFLSMRPQTQSEFRLAQNPEDIERLIGARSNVKTRQVTVPVSTRRPRDDTAATAAATAGRRKKISNADLERMGFLGEESTVPGRLTVGLNPRVAEARAAVQIARGTLPSRSIGTSFVQLTENLFGGRQKPLERLAKLQDRASDLEGLANRQVGLDALRSTRGAAAIRARAEARAPGATPEMVQAAKQVRGAFLDASKAVHENRNELMKATKNIDEMRKGVVGASDVMRNLAAGAVGGVVGGIAAGGVSAVTQTAIQATSAVIGPMIERMTGFQGTTGRVVNTLSDATLARGGDAAGAVASAGADAGFSKAAFDRISPELTNLAKIEAGNKAIVQQVDLTRAAQNLARGGGGGLLGFTNNQGGIPGLTQATGGLFGSSINATPSTAEAVFGGMPNAYGVQGNGPIESFFKLLDVFAGPTNSKAGPPVDSTMLAELNSDVKTFNDQVSKGGSSLKLMTGATQAQTDAYVKSLRSIKAGDAAYNLAQANHMAVVDAQGNVPDDAAKRSLEAYNTGSSMKDPALLLDSMKLQIQATVDQIKRDLSQSLSNNTANTAINQLAQPIAPLGRGLLSANTPAGVRATIAGAQGKYDTTTGAILDRADQGTSFLDKLKVPEDVRQSLADVGRQIDMIAGDEAKRQSDNFWIDYRHNVDLSQRSVSDLLGLVGQSSYTYKDIASSTGSSTVKASRVGVLENQNLALNRQSQVIGFQQQQNQLNFQTAVAGFAAPGLTGEERAARMEQAKKEAAAQQTILNNNRTVATNDFEITGIINKRSLDDAKFQLESLPRNLDMQVNIQIDQQQMAALDQVRTGILADIQSYTAAGNAFITTMNQALTSLEAQGSTYFNALEKDVERAFTEAFGNDPFKTGAGTTTGTSSTGTGEVLGPPNPNVAIPNGTSNDRGSANGGMGPGDVGGPGNVTPTQAGVIIQINGGTFTDEKSRAGLIRDVQRAVEQGMDRKASLIGLRTPR